MTFSVEISVDGSAFTSVDGGHVFQGSAASTSTAGTNANGGDDTVTAAFFAAPVTARYVRVVVQSKSDEAIHAAMRAGLIVGALPS